MAREGGNAGGDALVDDGERAARAGDGSWRGERGAAPGDVGKRSGGVLGGRIGLCGTDTLRDPPREACADCGVEHDCRDAEREC